MKLGWNLAAGLANSISSAVIVLAVTPLYLKFVGIEAYGLIGFFVLLQSLFGLLDMGLAPTINREVARGSIAKDQGEVRDLLHTVALIYWGLAAVTAAAMVWAAPFIGAHWLNASDLPPAMVAQAVMLMALIVAVRFPIGLYGGVLLGAQHMVAASLIEVTMIAAANIGAVVVLAWVSPTIQAFFVWQASVAVIYVVTIRAVAWRTLGRSEAVRGPRFDGAALRRIWRFAGAMAVTALLGTFFLQSDKLVLSRIVSLAALGQYTLAGVAARSLYLFMTPAFSAIYPRLSALHAEGDNAQVKILYKSGTRLLMAIIFPAAGFIGLFATDIMTLWTGNAGLAAAVTPLVRLLLFGTALNGAMHLPYALQLACGKSSLAMWISLILVVAFAPLVIVLALSYGAVGAAAAWAILNTLYLFLGTYMTHRSLLPGEGLRWLARDVGTPFAIAAVVTVGGGYLVQLLPLAEVWRLLLGALLAGAACLLSVASSGELRRGALRLRSRYLLSPGN
ncbi:MAG TPA: oligosaccharide flippase family protein [Caulobacteraceae bacterium]